jgi:DNA-binding CsgD family transcriptional regulator
MTEMSITIAGANLRSRGSAARLIGRVSERRMLDRLVSAVRSGESRALVLHGEPGVGKTALLDYLSEHAPGCQLARAAGVQSEMGLSFAGLHQLCAPMLDRLTALPAPQRDALRIAFGISAGPVPDSFLIGLAVLGLLSEAAADEPLLCVVDDQQWLDRASARILGFVARRLAADPVGLVFAARQPGPELAGLPWFVLDGLEEGDSRSLLKSVLPGVLDTQVRDLMIAETRGNPLALLELPRGLTPEQLAGGFGLPALPAAGRAEESFLRQFKALPIQTRRLVQLMAAEPSGDPALVWRAAARLKIPPRAAEPAVRTGLVKWGTRVQFRHPLARSVAYWSASRGDRRKLHAALAATSDPAAYPDRRAWHRAQATAGPDECVAVELERSAGRAQARGGLSAAAAFLERATLLTADAGRRATRAIAAAEAKHRAGAPNAAAVLLAVTEEALLDEPARARISLLQGKMALGSSDCADAPALMLEAARRFEAFDARLAREAYLDAMSAAMYVGRLAVPVELREVALAARRAPAEPHSDRPSDLLLKGLATLITDGYAVGTPTVRRAIRAFRDGAVSVEERIRWLFAVTCSTQATWDDDNWQVLASRQVRLVRDAGALSMLPFALMQRIGMHLHAGELAEVERLVAEFSAFKDATGNGVTGYGPMALAAWQGRVREAGDLIDAVISETTSRGLGMGVSLAQYTASLLHNGLGRYEDAMNWAELASRQAGESGFANWGRVELVEAAVRSGQLARAVSALERLAVTTRPSGTAWGRGIEARCRALLSQGDTAERLYGEAIVQLGSAPAKAELARAHLLYGEWLRRERRRGEAREQLRIAEGMLETMGMGAFAARARRELLATGEHGRPRSAVVPRPRDPGTSTGLAAGEALTAQEAQVARLARDGLSNPEIANRLFISPRTVQHHLSKVFAKLGVSSRGELHRVLIADPDHGRAELTWRHRPTGRRRGQAPRTTSGSRGLDGLSTRAVEPADSGSATSRPDPGIILSLPGSARARRSSWSGSGPGWHRMSAGP